MDEFSLFGWRSHVVHGSLSGRVSSTFCIPRGHTGLAWRLVCKLFLCWLSTGACVVGDLAAMHGVSSVCSATKSFVSQLCNLVNLIEMAVHQWTGCGKHPQQAGSTLWVGGFRLNIEFRLPSTDVFSFDVSPEPATANGVGTRSQRTAVGRRRSRRVGSQSVGSGKEGIDWPLPKSSQGSQCPRSTLMHHLGFGFSLVLFGCRE